MLPITTSETAAKQALPAANWRKTLADAELPDSAGTEIPGSENASFEPADGIALNRSGESSVVHLAGAIDIGRAAELKTALMAALEGRHIEVSAEALTGVDVTALQLLWAAGREAGKRGIDFAVSRANAETVGSQVAELGMEDLRIFG